MKKLLLALLVLFPSASVFADIKFDKINKRYYSTPLSPDIEQLKYHDICYKYELIFKAWAASYDIVIKNLPEITTGQIEQIDNLLKNPMALEDLKNRFSLYSKILETEATINPHHAATIARFFFDVAFLFLIVPTPLK